MSDYIKNNFLPEDHEQAEKQLDNYKYYQAIASRYVDNGQLEWATVFQEKASRSLKVLLELKGKHDRAYFRLKQIEADRTMKELIQSQLVKAYE